MGKLPLLIVSLLFVGTSALADQPVVGYQAWKAARIDEARSGLDRLQQGDSAKVIDKKADGSIEKKPEPSKAKVEQAQLALDVAQELTVHDYFLLYLRQLKSRESVIEAAKRLSPEDTADLLIAYQKHLAGSQQVDVIVPASAQLAPSAAGSLTK